MKIISLEIDSPRKIPLHKQRRYIDSLKADIVKEHNRKLKEAQNPERIQF